MHSRYPSNQTRLLLPVVPIAIAALLATGCADRNHDAPAPVAATAPASQALEPAKPVTPPASDTSPAAPPIAATRLPAPAAPAPAPAPVPPSAAAPSTTGPASGPASPPPVTETPKPEDQGTSESDRSITASLRTGIQQRKDLSAEARMIVIATREGVVTLRGPVASEPERDAILSLAHAIPEVQRVDDRLEPIVR